MQYHHKKTSTLCFDENDLKQLFELPTRARLAKEVINSGISPEALLTDIDKMRAIVDNVKVINTKEDIEIFSALYIYLRFYNTGSKVCFKLLDSADPAKDPVRSLEKLKSVIKENDLTDFLIKSDDGYRAFQLKTFTGDTDLQSLYSLIENKLKHYGYALGDVNLLITMQSKGDISENFFQELHERLKDLPIRGSGHVLVSYNENNTFYVINTVYPKLGTTRIEHRLPSDIS
jgi:hypothetical protein